MVLYVLLGLAFVALAFVTWRNAYPKPYPGIPYNEKSARRLTGDLPDLMPLVQSSHEFNDSLLTITTRKLGQPIAQLLLPAIRNPVIVIDDPREVEDILLRRNKEFDKASMSIDLFAPMFPNGSLSQFKSPKLKTQKRLWADAMSPEFLRRKAAPGIYKSTLDLLELWRLRASSETKDQPFDVYPDFQNAALDAIWVSLIGEDAGMTNYETRKLQSRITGKGDQQAEQPPRGAFVKEVTTYMANTITENTKAASPKWAQKLETYTPRYRKFRGIIATEIGLIMEKAVDKYHRAEVGELEADELDTCMVDLVLRRQVLEARKAGRPVPDPRKDQNILDEMLVMLVGGLDSSANNLSWFVKFMEAYPAVQTELRAALKAAFPGPGQPSVEDILGTDIPYFDATCEEVFRLAATAKGSMREATVDTQILGCRVPKGAQIFINFHIDRPAVPVDESKRSAGSKAAVAKLGDGLQGDAGRDLGVLEPRRWLVRDDKTGEEVFNAYAMPALAFGGGYRGCFGRKLATMEFRIAVVILILNFELQQLPDNLKSMSATESVFRQPDLPYVKLRVL